jgi:flagellar biosynthesis GTPase FlhF
VQYKEFGIRLNFTPIVNGNRVHLKVRPEVSTLDYANAVTLQGFRIPAFSTRRTETEIELENGQTFSIAGLMNNTMNSSLQKIPGIGDIPILGLLFKSKAAQKGQTELVVMITPEILPNGSVGVTPALPRLVEPFMPPAKKTFDTPPAPFPMAPPARSEGAAAAPAATAPATPAQTPTVAPAQAMPAAPAVKPSEEMKRQVNVSDEERRNAERMHKEATELAAAQKKRDEEAAREQAKRDEKAAKEQAKRDEKAAREQLKRDSLASKKQAVIDAAEKEEAARRAAEQAKKQAENDKRQQKTLDEARARLKAAEEVYQSELAKRGSRNQ